MLPAFLVVLLRAVGLLVAVLGLVLAVAGRGRARAPVLLLSARVRRANYFLRADSEGERGLLAACEFSLWLDRRRVELESPPSSFVFSSIFTVSSAGGSAGSLSSSYRPFISVFLL